MQSSKRSRELANEILKQQARLEGRAVRLAASIGFKAQRAFFQNYPLKVGGVDPVAAFQAVLMEAVPVLTNSMAVSHLASMKRVKETMPTPPAELKLSHEPFEAATQVLRRQLTLTSTVLDQIVATYRTESIAILERTGTLAAVQLQETMLAIQQEGLHVAAGKARLRDTFKAIGLTPSSSYALENQFRTQIQMAYGAGRWNVNRDPDVDGILWGYEYVTVGDTRVRPEHAGMDGVTLHKNDPFWATNFPPNGWSCRCQAIEIFDGPPEGGEQLPPTSFSTFQDGQPITVTPGADDGFQFNPGDAFSVGLV
jgi:SPP1 gp7 family putative phage head morphogenesis protein